MLIIKASWFLKTNLVCAVLCVQTRFAFKITYYTLLLTNVVNLTKLIFKPKKNSKCVCITQLCLEIRSRPGSDPRQ